MTYEEKVQRVIAKLDSDGADSEREWAENILRSIGITPETPNGPQPVPLERILFGNPDSNQDAIEASAERQG